MLTCSCRVADLKAVLESYTDPGEGGLGAGDAANSEAANGVVAKDVPSQAGA
jgi:hypothetical protein